MSKLLLDQAVSPPPLQAFASLDNVLLQLVSLRGNELLCTAEDSLADLTRYGSRPEWQWSRSSRKQGASTQTRAIFIITIHRIKRYRKRSIFIVETSFPAV